MNPSLVIRDAQEQNVTETLTKSPTLTTICDLSSFTVFRYKSNRPCWEFALNLVQ